MPDFNPEEMGARCDLCPLRAARVGGPVPSEIHADAKILIVGESPGQEECKVGRPFVGPSGQEMIQALRVAGLKREDVSWANSCSCRPPRDEMGKFLHRLEQENKKAESIARKAKAPFVRVPTPQQCCRPRLINEIKANNYHDVIAVGGSGFQTLTLSDKGIHAVRGGPYIADLLDTGGVVKIESESSPPTILGGWRLRILPTLHPAYVLRARRWTKVMRADVARAARWFQGRLAWKEPESIIFPTPAQLEEFLLGPITPGVSFWRSCDIETQYYNPDFLPEKIPLTNPQLQAKLYCIGFGTVDRAMAVPILGIDGKREFYNEYDLAALKDIIRRFLVDPQRYKVGHLFGYFDRGVIRRTLGVDPEPIIDTILLHRLVDSELPHSLAFVGSMFTDVTAWKAEESGTEARTDEELLRYNCVDVAVTARILPDLARMVQLRGQDRVMANDTKIQKICCSMHALGMGVNQTVRATWDRRLLDGKSLRGEQLFEYEFTDGAFVVDVSEAAARAQAKSEAPLKEAPLQVRGALQWKAEMRRLTGLPELNPSSVPQIARLLFENWKLEPKFFTELGDPSTGDDILREIMQRKSVKGDRKKALEALRRFRKCVKLRGTYTSKFRLCSEFIPEDEYADKKIGGGVERDEDEGDNSRRGIVLLDGRVHSTFNSHTTVSGRLASSRPNMQNIPPPLRNMFVPSPGNVYVYADMDQVELRMVAALAGASRYLEIFDRAYKARGGKIDKLDTSLDPHAGSAEMVFPSEWKVASRDAKMRIRDYAKKLVYCLLYGGSDETVHDIIVSTEDNRGRLVYADADIKSTSLKIQRWVEANPEIEAWWTAVVEKVRQDGFLAEPILGRRRDFLDGIDDLEETSGKIRNFGPQAGTAALVNLGTVELVEGPLPFEKFGPNTGAVNQTHDSLIFEVPEGKANWAKGQVQEALTQRFDCLPVWFTAEAKVITDGSGRKWSGA